MSDLQIVTGISILVSGYAQLRCGLSSYHWNILVYLAWFSALTHLCCLKIMRPYLYNHLGERSWRLAAMFVLLVLLVVAIVPTRGFYWDDKSIPQNQTPESYALCHFGVKVAYSEDSLTSMIVSILLLVLDFTSRSVRLFKSAFVYINEDIRRSLSVWARSQLKRLYTWLDMHHGTKPTRKFIIYRPCLVVLLVTRALIVTYLSMLIEV